MNDILPSLNHWIHLMSAIIWIGGAMFLAMAVSPVLRKHVEVNLAGKLAAGMYKKYQRVVGVLFLVILVTGGLNIKFVGDRLGGLDQDYIIFLSIKLVLVMILMTVFLYNVLFWSPATPDNDTSKNEEEVDPPDTRFPFQRTTIWTGMLIVLIASILKHLHL